MNSYNETDKSVFPETKKCVWIMTYTSEPVRTIFTAIRTCYSPYDQVYIAYTEYDKYLKKTMPENSPYPNDAIRLLAKVASMKHLSVLEHVSFTFGIRGVSRSLLAQLTRHRIGFSYSVQSQRYVDFDTESLSGGFDVIEPQTIANNNNTHLIFTQIIKDIQKSYNVLRDMGVPAEDARYIMPNAAVTNITLTCNLRAFLDFYQKRSDNHSQ